MPLRLDQAPKSTTTVVGYMALCIVLSTLFSVVTMAVASVAGTLLVATGYTGAAWAILAAYVVALAVLWLMATIPNTTVKDKFYSLMLLFVDTYVAGGTISNAKQLEWHKRISDRME